MILKVLNIKPRSLFEEIFLRSWWVLLFSLGCLMFYEQNQLNQKIFLSELIEKLDALNNQKIEAMKLNEELTLSINSQSDPGYVELTLMKVLGVISDGQLKFFFLDRAPYKLKNENHPHSKL